MEILEVTVEEFTKVIKNPYHAYGMADFNNLNKNKCDQVFYLLFKEGKYRLGIIGGFKDNVFYSPFSAPFGGFTYLSNDIRLQYIEKSVVLLRQWATERRISLISITLPPKIYSASFIAKQFHCLWRDNFEISRVDLNYSFDLLSLNNNYFEHIWHNARKNLRIALKYGLQFYKCLTSDEKYLAYNIIYNNRKDRGYPLKMSWQDIECTSRLISADFFYVSLENQKPCASAIVFHTCESVAQVIYWGDLTGFSEMKPMNFLAFKLFDHYKSCGKKFLDIGPSTEDSVPNYGLIEFKESIGCLTSTKLTLRASLKNEN